MSESDNPRRVVAEIRVGANQPAITKIGSRSVHHFWQALARDFQGILLAPQRRPDDGGVAWTWREAAGSKPVTQPELAGLRERLAAANRLFAKNLDGSDLGAEGVGGLSLEESVDQLRSRVNEMVAELVGKPDSSLAAFACRTDTGIRLHSWGASAPAQPFYPDARDFEVSGTVLAGEKGAADLEVVIESRTGVCLARTRTDASGGFRLQKIGPGTHRVRVISDRVDFPVSGVAVAVERTSIANLELRSTSVTVASGRASVTDLPDSPARTTVSIARAEAPAAAESRAQPGRRWLWGTVIATAALAVGGVGWWIWNLGNADDRHMDVSTGQSSFSGGRMVENGGDSERMRSSRLADLGRRSSASPAASLGPPMFGRDRQGSQRPSSPTSSVTDPKLTKSAGARGSSSAADRAANHALAEKNRPEPTGKPDPSMKATAAENSAPKNEPPPADVPDESERGKPEAGGDPGKSPATEKQSHAPEAAPPTPPVASPKAEAETPSAQVASGDGYADLAHTSNRRRTARSETTGAKSGSISSETAPAVGGSAPAEAGETDDSQDSSEAGDASRGASGTKSNPAPPAAGAAGNAPSGASPPTASGSPMAADESPDQMSASDPRAAALGAATANATGQGAARAHRAATQASLPTGPAPQAGSVESDTTSATVSATLPGQQLEKARASQESNKAERPPPAAAATPVDSSTAGAVEAVDPSPSRSRTSAAPPVAAARMPVAPVSHRAKNHLAPDAESAAGESSTLATGARLGASADAGEEAANRGRLGRPVVIRVSSWRPQLIQDVILPTEPVRAGEDDAIGSLREQYLLERQRRIPASFRNPALWNGCAVEVAASDQTEAGQLRWREASGGGAESTTVKGTRAEIAWPGGTPPANGRYVLCRNDGREIAHIMLDQGVVVIKAVEQVRCWFWVAIEPAAADSADPVKGQAEPRFEWQPRPGAALPELSRRDDHWRNGRAQRLDLPVDFRAVAGMSACPVVLVDRITGWAIESNIEQGSVAPPAR